MSILHFTHIPKTAGTSFVMSYLEPNYGPNCYYPSGFKEFARNSYPDHSCIRGHFPYGMHYLKPLRKHDYIIFFREPIERCRSHYYFVLQDRTHFDYPRFEKTPLKDVFSHTQKPHFFSALQGNLQTKFAAGIIYGFSGMFSEKKILEIAKKNLKYKYKMIGLQEQYKESCTRFEEKFKWKKVEIKKHFRKTHIKEELDTETKLAIENHNQLDLELYEFVKKNYYPKIY